MNLDTLREERQKWLTWKNIVPYQEAIKKLKDYDNAEVELGDRVKIQIEDLSPEDAAQIKDTALLMKPWRKGPFQLNDLFIDSEWQSQIKYNLLEPHFDLQDKIVIEKTINLASPPIYLSRSKTNVSTDSEIHTPASRIKISTSYGS